MGADGAEPAARAASRWQGRGEPFRAEGRRAASASLGPGITDREAAEAAAASPTLMPARGSRARRSHPDRPASTTRRTPPSAMPAMGRSSCVGPVTAPGSTSKNRPTSPPGPMPSSRRDGVLDRARDRPRCPVRRPPRGAGDRAWRTGRDPAGAAPARNPAASSPSGQHDLRPRHHRTTRPSSCPSPRPSAGPARAGTTRTNGSLRRRHGRSSTRSRSIVTVRSPHADGMLVIC